MLTEDMKRIVREQRLGFVATVNADGTPNLSPKGTFVVLDDATIGFGDIRSPGTMRNLATNPGIEVNFVDAFARKGYRFAGRATLVARGGPGFDGLAAQFSEYGALVPRMKTIVTIAIARALPLSTPAYDPGDVSEADLRKVWTGRFRAIQPGGAFVE